MLRLVTSTVENVRHGPDEGLGIWNLTCPVPGDALAIGTWTYVEWPCVEQIRPIGVLKLGISWRQEPMAGPANVSSDGVRPSSLLTH